MLLSDINYSQIRIRFTTNWDRKWLVLACKSNTAKYSTTFIKQCALKIDSKEDESNKLRF